MVRRGTRIQTFLQHRRAGRELRVLQFVTVLVTVDHDNPASSPKPVSCTALWWIPRPPRTPKSSVEHRRVLGSFPWSGRPRLLPPLLAARPRIATRPFETLTENPTPEGLLGLKARINETVRIENVVVVLVVSSTSRSSCSSRKP